MTDLIIIGAGCAGLTAAIYAQRAGLQTILLEENFYGGQIALTNEIENYPAIPSITGPELAQQLYGQAESLGAQIRFEMVTQAELTSHPKIITTNVGRYEAKAVIVANGAKRRKLGCPGEAELSGRGVSYCATCDGAFFRGKDVAIVGGGNTALEDALFLSNVCRTVFLIHRRDTFRGEKSLAERVRQRENIHLLYDSTVTEIRGDAAVSAAVIQNLKTGAQQELPVSAVFIAIGLMPENGIFSRQLPLDENGYFLAGEDCKTPLAGVFVAGDCRTKPLRQIVTAAADGAVAGYQAASYIG